MMSLDFIAATFMRLMAALQVTLSVWALSVFIGAFIGGGVAWMRVSGVKHLEWLARAYVFVFRGAPLLVQLFVVYYGLSSFPAVRASIFDARFVGLMMDRSRLYARIDQRVDAMVEAGMLDEVRSLVETGLGTALTAMQAIGYRQVVEHLRGERSLAETIEQVKIRTRQFARRQLTWFRRQLDPEWIELKPGESLEMVLADLQRRTRVKE